jgi:hypothetical protein
MVSACLSRDSVVQRGIFSNAKTAKRAKKKGKPLRSSPLCGEKNSVQSARHFFIFLRVGSVDFQEVAAGARRRRLD